MFHESHKNDCVEEKVLFLSLLPSPILNSQLWKKHNEHGKGASAGFAVCTTREKPKVRRTQSLIGVSAKKEHRITSKSNSGVCLSPFWLRLACLWKLFPLAPPLSSCFLFHLLAGVI